MQDAAVVQLEELRDVSVEVHSLQAGRRQDDARELGVLVELAQPRLDVAPVVLELEVRVSSRELGDSAHAAGADDASRRQVGQALPAVFVGQFLLQHQRVARVLPLGDAAEQQAVGQRRGHVL